MDEIAGIVQRLERLESRLKAVESKLMPQSMEDIEITCDVEPQPNRVTEGEDPVG
jgi:hypothetical protein